MKSETSKGPGKIPGPFFIRSSQCILDFHALENDF